MLLVQQKHRLVKRAKPHTKKWRIVKNGQNNKL